MGRRRSARRRRDCGCRRPLSPSTFACWRTRAWWRAISTVERTGCAWVGTPALPAERPPYHHAYDDSRTYFRAEEDFPGPKTMATAADWIEDQRRLWTSKLDTIEAMLKEESVRDD